MFPSGHLVDEEIYFAIRFMPDVEKAVLLLHRYAFLIDPGAHTRRVVRREGYWHFDVSVAGSPSESINLLKHQMHSLEILALNRDTISYSPDISFSSLVAWEERMALAARTPWKY